MSTLAPHGWPLHPLHRLRAETAGTGTHHQGTQSMNVQQKQPGTHGIDPYPLPGRTRW